MKKRTNGRMWTRQDAKDAARLLAELAQRAERASGGSQRPEQIPDSTGKVPAVPSRKAGQESAEGVARHPGQQPVGQSGEKVADAVGGEPASASAQYGEDMPRRFLIANNDNGAGRVTASEAGVIVRMHRPATSADLYTNEFTRLESFQKTSHARWEW